MAAKSKRPATPKPPESMNRFMKGLLTVPAEELEREKAAYEREKRLRQQRGHSPGPRPAA
jgi:hypothetical protein